MPEPGGQAEHHRHLRLAAEHVADLGALEHELFHRQGQEIHELHLGDGRHPGDGGTDRSARNGGLSDGGIAHPLRPEFVDQPLRHLESAAVHADVFPIR